MNEERNLLNLVDIVSSRTKQDPALVRKFLHHFFKEIEKELVTSSFVNIDGLGIFRIIKSIPSDRILFLGKFNSEKESNIEENTSTEYSENETKTSSFDSFVNNNSESENNQEFTDDIDSSFNFDNNYDNNTDNEAHSFENNDKAIIENYRLEEYENHQEQSENKRKKRSIIQIIILLLLTIAAVLFLLTTLQQKDNKEDSIIPIVQNTPEYTIINDDDTLNTNIRLDSSADFLSLSKTFYDHEDYWGYIYMANVDDMQTKDPFTPLTSKSIVKIPRLTAEQQNIDSAKVLVNKIFEYLRSRNQ